MVKFTITNLMDTHLELRIPQNQPQRPHTLAEEKPTVVLPGQTAGPFESRLGVSPALKAWERKGRIRINYITDDSPAKPKPKSETKDKETSKSEEKDK